MRSGFLVPLMLLAACGGEPDFDERYEQAGEEIRARAESIDAQLEGKAPDSEDGDLPAEE
jgi:hypothetical protein